MKQDRDGLLYVGVACGNCGRELPIRVFREAAEFMRGLPVEIPPNLVVQSFRCRCKCVTLLTARALLLAKEAAPG